MCVSPLHLRFMPSYCLTICIFFIYISMRTVQRKNISLSISAEDWAFWVMVWVIWVWGRGRKSIYCWDNFKLFAQVYWRGNCLLWIHLNPYEFIYSFSWYELSAYHELVFLVSDDTKKESSREQDRQRNFAKWNWHSVRQWHREETENKYIS